MPDITPINIAVVGLNFGRLILEELQRERPSRYFRIAGVCDLDAEKAASYGERLGVKTFTDIDRLLEDPDIPVIGLYTGPVKRADLLRKIIRAGKDVMTTKPFELDPAAARSVLEEAASLGRTIFLNSPSPRPAADIRKILDWQREFDLGRPIGCRGEVVVSYREKADGSWYDNPLLCPSAPVFRLGIYLINDLVRLFGAVDETGVLSSRIFTGRPTPDNAQLNLLFKNGALGSVYASFCVEDGQYYANTLLLHYERGTIHRNVSFTSYGQSNLTSRLSLVAKAGERELALENCTLSEDIGYQWDVFHETLTGVEKTPMPIDDVVHGVEVISAMAKAEQSRRMEKISH